MSRREKNPNVKTIGFKQPRSVLVDRLAAAVVIVLAAFAATIGFRGMPQTDHRQIAARPFAWPEGCTPAAYADGHPIARGCAVSSNAIIHPEKMGLTYNARSRGKQWFRVGNDALLIFCGFGNKYCSVYSSIRGKFVVI